MVNTPQDTLALAAGLLAMIFILRMKRTYFLDSRFFIAVANIAFNLILVQALFSDVTGLPPSPIFFVGMISVTAIAIGFASYLLENNLPYSGVSELRAFLSNPPRPFLVFLTVVLAWAISGLVLNPWSPVQSLNQENVPYFSYQLWYLGLSSVLLIAFICLPVATVYHLSKVMSDSKASRSLKIISVSWSGFGIISLFQVALPLAQSMGVVVESILFIMIAFALKEPTVLSRIISAASSGLQHPRSFIGTDKIVLYNIDSDRRRLIESFVRDEMRARRRAVCFVPKSETPLYSIILRGIGVSFRPLEGLGVSIQPIENMSLSASSLPDVESELIDLGELDLIQSRNIVEREKALDESEVNRKRNRTWAINVESAHPSLLGLIRDLNPKARTIDQASYQDAFSNLLGLRHLEILGTGVLLEFDPSSRYDAVLQKFVDECQANVEPIAIFTSLGSPVHKGLSKLQGIRLFSFSTKTSTPSKGVGDEVLLPERDSSLLLDAVDKVLETNQGQRVALAFDVFTDLILLQGFDKTYGVLSAVVEMAESRSATTLVLLNQTALEERLLNGVRGLFGTQVVCDSTSVRLIRFKDSSSRKNRGVKKSFPYRNNSEGLSHP